ncbi:unnamed protein product [Kluyveromyces dobzhanskii CBS 2104]|uniref:WGS project CCBQ000000000 data, contig 00015 n=1 Tax=Kluyveromyces dobzhanskii CBS 2104 TaxID=1427455 RepID=A0A0A8LCP3_9SACH|nr:unnamed protein product [Kluyveromyces dobzhanskii CBS 2104]
MSNSPKNTDKKEQDIGNLVFKRAGKTVEVDPKSLRAPKLYVPVKHDRSASTQQNASPLIQNGGHRPTVDPRPQSDASQPHSSESPKDNNSDDVNDE